MSLSRIECIAQIKACDAARADSLGDSDADPRALEGITEDSNLGSSSASAAADAGDDGAATAAAAGADDQATPTHEEGGKSGYLSKRNKRGKWKKRWIVLSAELLQFFNDKEEAAKNEPAKDTLQLLFCSAKPSVGSDAAHGFSIFAKDQTHEFSASSAAERDAWLSAIQRNSG